MGHPLFAGDRKANVTSDFKRAAEVFNMADVQSILSSQAGRTEGGERYDSLSDPMPAPLNSDRMKTHTQGFGDYSQITPHQTPTRLAFLQTQGTPFGTGAHQASMTNRDNKIQHIQVNPRLHSPAKFVINQPRNSLSLH